MHATLALRSPSFNGFGKSLLHCERSRFALVTATRMRNYTLLKVQKEFSSLSTWALRTLYLVYLELIYTWWCSCSGEQHVLDVLVHFHSTFCPNTAVHVPPRSPAKTPFGSSLLSYVMNCGHSSPVVGSSNVLQAHLKMPRWALRICTHCLMLVIYRISSKLWICQWAHKILISLRSQMFRKGQNATKAVENIPPHSLPPPTHRCQHIVMMVAVIVIIL